MPRGLHRFRESGHSHFVTFSCRHRQAYFSRGEPFDEFIRCLERMRQRYELRVYGYVVMPEHVHLLLSEPGQGKLADALHDLKLSFSKRLPGLRSQLAQVRARPLGANLGEAKPDQDPRRGRILG
jgi:putative transposase